MEFPRFVCVCVQVCMESFQKDHYGITWENKGKAKRPIRKLAYVSMGEKWEKCSGLN